MERVCTRWEKKMLSFLSFLSVLVWCAGERPGGVPSGGLAAPFPPLQSGESSRNTITV